MNKECVDIAYICDDAYVLPTIVSIMSLINSKKCSSNYTVHVCTFGISNENELKITKLSSDTVKVVVEVFDKVRLEDKIKRISQKSHVTPTALIKLELPQYFYSFDKLLYLDGDIIIKNDINELLNIDLHDNYMAASFEYWNHYNNIRYTFRGGKNDVFYFNSGVMLMNLRKMRDDKITEALWDYKLNKAKTTLMDQECLNAVCSKKTVPISIKWNLNPIFISNSHIKEINKVYSEEYVDADELFAKAAIIHYVGKEDKPWIYKNARKRENWDCCFKMLEEKETLVLKEYEKKEKKVFNKIREIREKFGIVGVVCFFRFWIFQKICKNK